MVGPYIGDDAGMNVTDAFCGLVLGEPGAVSSAAVPAVSEQGSLAGLQVAWPACEEELARRRGSLAWDEPPGAEGGTAVARLPAVPERERAALAAQAVGLGVEDVEQLLGVGPGEGERLLARGHAALSGLGRPAGEACAAAQAGLAVGRGERRAHCAECAAFGRAVADQRSALCRAAGVAPGPPVATGSRRPPLGPSGPGGRVAIGLVVLLVSGLAGFGVVRTVVRPAGSGGGDGVVTATPVRPVPPGVNPRP
jgi:hypothetical protein